MSSFFSPCPCGDYNICKLCNGKIKCRPDGGTSSINRHVKLKHPDELNKFAESEFNPSFHNHGILSEDGMVSCRREQKEHDDSETADIDNKVLRCVTMLLGYMKNIKKEVDVLKKKQDKEKTEL